MKTFREELTMLCRQMRYWPPELRGPAILAFCAKYNLLVRWYWVRDPFASFGLFTVGVVLRLTVPGVPELTMTTAVSHRLPRRGLRTALAREVTSLP